MAILAHHTHEALPGSNRGAVMLCDLLNPIYSTFVHKVFSVQGVGGYANKINYLCLAVIAITVCF